MVASSILRNATLGVAMISAATLGATSAADAHHWRHHHHNNWGWTGAAFAGGLAVGALASSRYRAYPGCVREKHVYWRHGHRVVRWVRVCY